jgi:broad specificity phosphatase PhoE
MTPTSTLILVRSAATTATRRAAFPADEPLDAGGTRDAGALVHAPALRGAERLLTSPALRARQTAALGPAVVASGTVTVTVDEALADAGAGDWRGLTLAEAAERDPKRLTAWLDDPDARPPGAGGESRRELLARVGAYLDRLHASASTGEARVDPAGGDGQAPGTTVAVTHGAWVRAAVLLALGAPPAAFWRIDVAPASLTVLHRRERGWALARVNWTAP